MMTQAGLRQFIQKNRDQFQSGAASVRMVYVSELCRNGATGTSLDKYVFDKAPLFYRELPKLMQSLGDGYFTSAIKETLDRLPTAQSFQESHFGEIVAAIFAEEAIGLRRIYSKLTLLTAENANAYKMDLILYDPTLDPIVLVFGEVKSSPKTAADGLPANHHESCYAEIFRRMNQYGESDRDFDLQSAKDRLDSLPSEERARLRQALLPYSGTRIQYAAFAVIDVSTKDDNEMSVLTSRKNARAFDVDVICIEDFPSVADGVFQKLDALRRACSP